VLRTLSAVTGDPNSISSPDAVLGAIAASPADYIKVAIVDIDGILRGKYMDKAKFLSSARGDGFGFCDVVFGWDSADELYDAAPYTGWENGYPDGAARIDLATHRQIPWEDGRDFFLCDYVGSADYSVCPRLVLKGIDERATALGYTGFFGMEFEWFNYRETPQSVNDKGFRDLEPLTPGMFGYSVLRQSQNQPFFDALLKDLRAFGVPLEGLHTETGPGVYEGAILYSTAIECADRGVLFKAGTKEIGHRFGIMPTFMARVDTTLPGCSGHTHQSLWDADAETNLFYDGDDPTKMSALFRSYVAGIVELLPEILALVAPTVNSYKRLVDGFWAPTKPTWGIDNRTVGCRVIPGSSKSTRLEFRVPGSDVNPYLSVAACFAAGLYGIERGLELGPATQGSAYLDDSVERLPRNLRDATDRLAGSKVVRELLGDGFVDHYCATRDWEWRQFQDSVTDWETKRYFEII
jgi:glutamine synthetase